MQSFDPVSALLGGFLIGLSATLLLAINGRVAGISGMLHSVLHPVSGQTYWRYFFLIGLLLGSIFWSMTDVQALTVEREHPLWRVAVGGFLVGIGTRLSKGCTSGHGVCGIGRLSPRSIVATLIFMATAMITASAVVLVGGVK